ncbi:MAG: dephospho-CoA kinase [Desulfobacula sp.]|nr:dephospho-CoA kinase [Desulfobacula sp.]
MLKIAVTGSAGSGKSLVCRHFKTMGLVVLDCDVIARQVVEPGTAGFEKIVALFGGKTVCKNGTLDRAKLRNIIINEPEMRRKMEDILHPQINKEMVFQMDTAQYLKYKAVAVEVPLLFELGMEHNFDTTIAVIAKDMELVKRICDRDSVIKEDALKMLELQMSQKEKKKKADHVIVNSGDRSELFESVQNIFNKIQKQFI